MVFRHIPFFLKPIALRLRKLVQPGPCLPPPPEDSKYQRLIKMKRRKYALIILAVLAAVTGMLEYKMGSTVNTNDWQNRSIYTDLFRPFLLPAFIGLLIIVIAVTIYNSTHTDEDMWTSD